MYKGLCFTQVLLYILCGVLRSTIKVFFFWNFFLSCHSFVFPATNVQPQLGSKALIDKQESKKFPYDNDNDNEYMLLTFEIFIQQLCTFSFYYAVCLRETEKSVGRR